MNKVGTIIFTGLCGLFLSAALQAEELAQLITPPPVVKPQIDRLPQGLDSVISLDLRGIEINDALKYFSLKSGLNIVTTKSVTGRVTLIVENVTVKDVFDIMLRSNGLAYDKTGEIYNVMTEKEYSDLYGRKFSDVREVRVFPLQYAVPEKAFSLLDTIKSDVGRVFVDTESGKVLCMDSPGNLDRMQAALEQFEKQRETRVFTLNYAKAKIVEEQLVKRLDEKKVGSIRADERANQVIVEALPQRMIEIEKLISALDVKTKQVLIDAKVLKVNISDEAQSGVRWEGLFDASEKNGLTYVGSTPFSWVGSSSDEWKSRKQAFQDTGYVGSYPSSGTSLGNFSSSTPIMGLSNMHIGIIGAHDVDFVLNYLKTEVNAKLLSSPKIAVTNKQEARIHVGAREAYVTTTTTTGQSTSTISEQVNFIDIGIQMVVTPIINEAGFIDMKIKTEISSVVDTLVTPSQNEIPIVDTSLAETNVLVKDGATIVIGGLRREEKTSVGRRVPILSKIPLIGKLFQENQNDESRSETLIMITPTIISGEALVFEEGVKVGEPNIKAVQKYEPIADPEKQLPQYPPKAEFGGMEIKGLKQYDQQ